jgi:hypothetical protein
VLAWPVMSRAPAFASVVAVSLLSTSFAFAQLPPSEVLPPTPPRAAATAPTTTTPPVTAASVLAPVAGWNLAAPAPQRALTRERLRLLNHSLLALPERSRSGRITEGVINLALGGGLFALGFLFSSDTDGASPLRTLLWFQGGYSALNGAVGLAWTPARERLPPVYGAMPMRTGPQRRARLQYGEEALDEMARDSRLRRTLTGVGSAVLGLGTLTILYRDQIFDNAAMPEPTEFNYLIIGLSLVGVAANVITVFSQTEEERIRANYRQELQLLRESGEE